MCSAVGGEGSERVKVKAKEEVHIALQPLGGGDLWKASAQAQAPRLHALALPLTLPSLNGGVVLLPGIILPASVCQAPSQGLYTLVSFEYPCRCILGV